MILPGEIVVLLEIILIEVALLLVQRMVIKARQDRRCEKDWQLDHAHGLMYLTEHMEKFNTKMEKTTSEKDEDLNGPDDPDVNDFLD